MKTFTFNTLSHRGNERKLRAIWLIAVLVNLLMLQHVTSTLYQQKNIRKANYSLIAPEPLIETSNVSYDVDDIVSANLFGNPNRDEPTVEPLPQTTLSIKLSGVLSNPNQASARAIISSKTGKENTYSTGETIDGTNASIVQIRPLEVLLEIGGKMETLALTKATAMKNNRSPSNDPTLSIAEPVSLDRPFSLDQPVPLSN
jgi:type II secretion system protein C